MLAIAAVFCALSDSPKVQFITLTFDDAVNQLIQSTILFNNKNKGLSCDIPATYYVSNNFTDYYQTSQLYHQYGYEIATHSVNHPDLPDELEIGSSRAATSFYANIPFEKIQGFRAPFLHANSDLLQNLNDLGFKYDSSLTTSDSIFPYYMDKVLNKCEGCDLLSLPELISIPVYSSIDSSGNIAATMDPILGTKKKVLDLWKSNLEKHNDNKLPFGIYLHPATLLSQTYLMDALKEFIEYAIDQEDTYFVTNQQMLAYLQSDQPDIQEWLEKEQCGTRDPSKLCGIQY